MSSKHRKVLIAESDSIVLALLSHILIREGYSVEVASTSTDAAKRLESERFDAIVLDTKFWSALESSGVMASKTILLGSNGTEPKVHAIIEKPIEFAALMDAVETCLQQ